MSSHPWYKTRTWKDLRLYHLKRNPLCVMCQAEGVTKAANVADHIKPHRNDWALFVDALNLQSLCEPHHNRDKQREEHAPPMCDEDGYPVEQEANACNT